MLCSQGGLALAEWCVKHSHWFDSRRVLELGCGLGLTGLTVCTLCRPLSYTFTDCHHKVLSVLEQNLTLNKSLLTNTAISTQQLNWDNTQNCQLVNPVDILLAAGMLKI